MPLAMRHPFASESSKPRACPGHQRHSFIARTRGALCLVALCFTALSRSAGAADSTPPPGPALFAPAAFHRIEIQLSPTSEAGLRREPRRDVRATVVIDDVAYPESRLHLKGATGSFRPIDDRPSLTVKLRDDGGETTLKFHLNNAVEDPGLLNEWFGTEAFREAGVPAPRVAHARVSLNRHSLGLYVLKESFNEAFLANHLPPGGGHLYEPVGGSDVDGSMRLAGEGNNDPEARPLQRLALAAATPNPERRWQRLGEVLERDQFMTLIALEVLIGHRDGYALARNNYRVYAEPANGRCRFLPHGMDQLLGRADLPWHPQMAGLVARAVLETPEGDRAYRERLAQLLDGPLKPEVWTPRLDALVRDLAPALRRNELTVFSRGAELLKTRLARRVESLRQQLAQPDPGPLAFQAREARLERWVPVDAASARAMDRTPAPDGLASLHIAAGARTSASWRCRVTLLRGRYRFEGRVQTRGLRPLEVGQTHGAALRLGGRRERSEAVPDEGVWYPLKLDCRVTDVAEEVEFICELRAGAGEAWFELGSLRLVKAD